MKLQIVPATLAHWPDVVTLFAGTPCNCQYWRQSAGDYGRPTRATIERFITARRRRLRQQLAGPTPPGILAYVDGAVAGWCGLGPRSTFQRLQRSRTIPAVDDQPVWSLVCFLVLPAYRRQGVASALLEGAIRCARDHGAPALEAYPIDPEGRRVHGTAAYVGTTALFEQAGFHRVAVTAARSAGLPRWIMRRALRNGAA